MSDCSMCHDVGWLLDAKRPVCGEQEVEMMPCLLPDCEASGRPIYNLSFVGVRFGHASVHPQERWVMSLSSPAKEERPALPTRTWVADTRPLWRRSLDAVRRRLRIR